ncbi:short chain dehydrogenase [Nemania serpens]|nr:short chain dehydrogenase [Nemania serpens]
MAERMIEHGSFVIAVGRRKNRLDEFAAKHGPDKVATSQFDVTYMDGIKSTSYVALLAAFLPHLQRQNWPVLWGETAAVIAVSSSLAIVPLPSCANHCATKAALHSLMWSLRAQFAADPGSRHIRVVEIVPPPTELPELQDDLRVGFAHIGITIEEYMRDDCWAGLERGDLEIHIEPIATSFLGLEDRRRAKFHGFMNDIATGRLPK